MILYYSFFISKWIFQITKLLVDDKRVIVLGRVYFDRQIGALHAVCSHFGYFTVFFYQRKEKSKENVQK